MSLLNSLALNKNFSGTLEVSNDWELTENTLFFKYRAATQLLELCFFRNGERYNQEIGIAQLETNLKNGYRFYFVCPHTRKRCTKLLRSFGNGGFLHRTACKDLYCEKQKESKKYRAISNSRWGIACAIDNLQRELYGERPKYQKTHYRGKVTPKYKKLKQLKEKCEEANNEALKKVVGFGGD